MFTAPYITFREADEEGILRYYILQREHPHYIGVITDKPSSYTLTAVQIQGYRLSVSFGGTLRGNFVPAYNGVYEDLETVFKDMAGWYYKNRIVPNEKNYTKFKINT